MKAGDQPVNTGTWYLEFNVEMVFNSSQSIARYIGPGPDCQSVVTNSLHNSLRLFVKWSRFLSPVLTDPGTRCNCPQSVHLTELWQETVSLPLQTPQAVTNLVTTYQQSLTPVSTSPPWGNPSHTCTHKPFIPDCWKMWTRTYKAGSVVVMMRMIMRTCHIFGLDDLRLHHPILQINTR